MTSQPDFRKLLEEATSLPWEANTALNTWIMAGPVHVATIPRAFDGDWSPSNAALIVAAVNALPEHLARIAELEAANERLKIVLWELYTCSCAIIDDLDDSDTAKDGDVERFEDALHEACAALSGGKP
jgi:hypothetical protein